MKTLSTFGQILGLIATLFCGVYLMRNVGQSEPKESVNIRRAKIQIRLDSMQSALTMEVIERQYQDAIKSVK